jgi:pSer/pThr/pTyr-binding forkhead associated (FHA) protein
MQKLVILERGDVKEELVLEDKEIQIGRDANCSLCLTDPAVSRHHAKLTRIYDDYCLEDLESTNGTLVNGRPVNKHVLRDGDVLQLGEHELHYQDSTGAPQEDQLEKTQVIRPQAATAPPGKVSPRLNGNRTKARVRFLQGPEAGTTKQLNKALLTIGKPGSDLAVVSRRPQGYFLLHLGGARFATVNGTPVQGGGVRLRNGDRIAVGENEVEFVSGR